MQLSFRDIYDNLYSAEDRFIAIFVRFQSDDQVAVLLLLHAPLMFNSKRRLSRYRLSIITQL